MGALPEEVGAKWRRQGIGKSLLDAAMEWASSHEASALRLSFARDDWPMRHLAGRCGARLDLVLGQMIAEIPARRASRPSLPGDPGRHCRLRCRATRSTTVLTTLLFVTAFALPPTGNLVHLSLELDGFSGYFAISYPHAASNSRRIRDALRAVC